MLHNTHSKKVLNLFMHLFDNAKRTFVLATIYLFRYCLKTIPFPTFSNSCCSVSLSLHWLLVEKLTLKSVHIRGPLRWLNSHCIFKWHFISFRSPQNRILQSVSKGTEMKRKWIKQLKWTSFRFKVPSENVGEMPFLHLCTVIDLGKECPVLVPQDLPQQRLSTDVK